RRGTAPRASGHRAVRDRAHDDAPRAALAPSPRLLDAAEVRARARPEGDRRADRAALPPLRAVRRPRLLALSDPGLGHGRGLAPTPRAPPAPAPRGPATAGPRGRARTGRRGARPARAPAPSRARVGRDRPSAPPSGAASRPEHVAVAAPSTRTRSSCRGRSGGGRRGRPA